MFSDYESVYEMEAGPAPEPDVDFDQPDVDQAEVIDDSDTEEVRPSETFQQTGSVNLSVIIIFTIINQKISNQQL